MGQLPHLFYPEYKTKCESFAFGCAELYHIIRSASSILRLYFSIATCGVIGRIYGPGLDTGATSVVYWKVRPGVVYRRQVGAKIISRILRAVNRCFHLENICCLVAFGTKTRYNLHMDTRKHNKKHKLDKILFLLVFVL